MSAFFKNLKLRRGCYPSSQGFQPGTLTSPSVGWVGHHMQASLVTSMIDCENRSLLRYIWAMKKKFNSHVGKQNKITCFLQKCDEKWRTRYGVPDCHQERLHILSIHKVLVGFRSEK